MIGIVGLGLIGGSIAMSVRETGGEVAGFDPNSESEQKALSRKAVDHIWERERIYAQCETIIIAAPPRATIQELRSKEARDSSTTLMLDTASVKQPIVDAARDVPAFVATHPLAGSEQSGIAAARSDLFEGKSWVYVPSGNAQLDSTARQFIESIGSKPVALAAARHDALIALTSHVPQVFATIFSAQARDRAGTELDAMAGPVARELLRLSRSNPELWSEILSYNAANVTRELRSLTDALNDFARAIEGGAALTVRDAFLRAQP